MSTTPDVGVICAGPADNNKLARPGSWQEARNFVEGWMPPVYNTSFTDRSST